MVHRHAIHAPVGGIESSKCDASCGSKSYGYYSIWMDDMESRKKSKATEKFVASVTFSKVQVCLIVDLDGMW